MSKIYREEINMTEYYKDEDLDCLIKKFMNRVG